MESIRIEVPGPPRGAERARSRIVTPRGKPSFITTYTPAQTRSEQSAIRLFAAQAMEGRAPLAGAIDLRVSAFFPVPASWSNRKREAALNDQIRPTGRPDFDNIAKLICDSLKGITWVDDAQITEAHVWKRYSDKPRIVVDIRSVLQPVETMHRARNEVSPAELPLRGVTKRS